MSNVRVSVDSSQCVLSGTCVDVAPELFELGDDGVAHPTAAARTDSDDLQEAVRYCPVRAITVAAD